jgi:hypothetical protein
MDAEIGKRLGGTTNRALDAFGYQQGFPGYKLVLVASDADLPSTGHGDHEYVDLIVRMGRDLLLTAPGKERQIEVLALMAPLWPAPGMLVEDPEIDTYGGGL